MAYVGDIQFQCLHVAIRQQLAESGVVRGTIALGAFRPIQSQQWLPD